MQVCGLHVSFAFFVLSHITRFLYLTFSKDSNASTEIPFSLSCPAVQTPFQKLMVQMNSRYKAEEMEEEDNTMEADVSDEEMARRYPLPFTTE